MTVRQILSPPTSRSWPAGREFVALMALLMAMNALSIDIVLPALGIIGDQFVLEEGNLIQLIITSYVMAFGVAQLVIGPISDRFGRWPVLVIGLVFYTAANLFAAAAPGFAALLIARACQGAAASALRICTVSVIRDRYHGRKMASVMSLVMMVFMAAPLFAPALGQGLLFLGHWSLIFLACALIGVGGGVWVYLRLPESLALENRRPIRPAVLMEGYGRILRCRSALGYMIASGFVFGVLFSFITASNQLMLEAYGIGTWFPLAFAAVAGTLLIPASGFFSASGRGRRVLGLLFAAEAALGAGVLFGLPVLTPWLICVVASPWIVNVVLVRGR